MNELQIFRNPEFGQIRSMIIDDEPWFVGKDVAESLGYKLGRKAILDHIDDDDSRAFQIGTPGGNQKMTIINESGLYSLIFSSQLPSAKKFKSWVTHEVLPAIRKTGTYSTQPLTKSDYIKAAQIISGCTQKQLPIVLNLLKAAGFETPEPQVKQKKKKEYKLPPKKRDHELVALLNRYSLPELCRRLNLPKSTLYYYRVGDHRPDPGRRKFIMDTLK